MLYPDREAVDIFQVYNPYHDYSLFSVQGKGLISFEVYSRSLGLFMVTAIRKKLGLSDTGQSELTPDQRKTTQPRRQHY